ncbi:hypothetical protein WG66_003120 [Moniliophthora roreri]|nr:hypothetical protein WG66_003120 [Moniliophthora roreri]
MDSGPLLITTAAPLKLENNPQGTSALLDKREESLGDRTKNPDQQTGSRTRGGDAKSYSDTFRIAVPFFDLNMSTLANAHSSTNAHHECNAPRHQKSTHPPPTRVSGGEQ